MHVIRGNHEWVTFLRLTILLGFYGVYVLSMFVFGSVVGFPISYVWFTLLLMYLWGATLFICHFCRGLWWWKGYLVRGGHKYWAAMLSSHFLEKDGRTKCAGAWLYSNRLRHKRHTWNDVSVVDETPILRAEAPVLCALRMTAFHFGLILRAELMCITIMYICE